MEGESDDAYRMRETLLDLEEKENYQIYGQFCIRINKLVINRKSEISIQEYESFSDESDSEPGKNEVISDERIVQVVDADITEIDVHKERQDQTKQNPEFLLLNEENAELKAKNESMATQLKKSDEEIQMANERAVMDRKRITELEQRLKVFEVEREEMAELKAKYEAITKKTDENTK